MISFVSCFPKRKSCCATGTLQRFNGFEIIWIPRIRVLWFGISFCIDWVSFVFPFWLNYICPPFLCSHFLYSLRHASPLKKFWICGDDTVPSSFETLTKMYCTLLMIIQQSLLCHLSLYKAKTIDVSFLLSCKLPNRPNNIYLFLFDTLLNCSKSLSLSRSEKSLGENCEINAK